MPQIAEIQETLASLAGLAAKKHRIREAGLKEWELDRLLFLIFRLIFSLPGPCVLVNLRHSPLPPAKKSIA